MGHFSTFTEQSNTKKHPILTFLTWLPFNQPTPNQPVLTHFCSTQFTQVFIMKYISEELAVIFWIKYFQTFKNAKPGRHFSLVSCLWFEMFTADRFCLSSGRTIKANQRQIEDRGEKISSRLARFGLVHPADIHWIAGRGGGGRRIAPASILLSSPNTKNFFLPSASQLLLLVDQSPAGRPPCEAARCRQTLRCSRIVSCALLRSQQGPPLCRQCSVRYCAKKPFSQGVN